jgi:PAS domain S-box-containing protein
LTQLFLIYQKDIAQINSNFGYIESSYLASISEAVYRIDDQLLVTMLDGVLNLQDIVYIEVVEVSGESKFVTSRGDESRAKDVIRKFPLQIEFLNATEISLGWMNVYASYEGVFERLWSQVVILLLTNITKTLLAGVFIYLIFQSFLSRHLIRIADMVNEMKTGGKDRNYTISLNRKPGKEDELDQLVRNINNMWVTLSDEITFRRMSENLLKESEKRYSLIMAASPDPIITYDMDGNVVFINPAFSETFGWNYDETVGHRIGYVPTGAKSEIDAMHAAVVENEYFFRFNSWRSKKNGDALEIDLSCGIWRNDAGEPGGSVVILRDVTAQKKLERQLQKAQQLEAIGTLAGGIAHDFNNILAVITGQAELMEMTALEPNSTNSKRIKEIISAADRAKHLISQILAASRHNITTNAPIDLIPLVKETVKFIRASTPANINIHYDIRTSNAVVLSDASRINQVLLNLCTNAVQSMGEMDGQLEVMLEAVQLDETGAKEYAELEAGPYIRILVSDTGGGIPADVLEQIFDPYFTTKSRSGGTGLGLAVVHGIVKNLKGNISVHSDVDRGTTFCVLLPSLEADISKETKRVETLIEQGHESIMLVDDNEQLLETGRAILEQLGYKVTAYDDPQAALDAFSEAPDNFDLVITDYTMPKLNGRALYRALTGVRPTVKVVLCSGYGEKISAESTRKEGFCAFLPKPFEIRVLARTIRVALDQIIATG